MKQNRLSVGCSSLAIAPSINTSGSRDRSHFRYTRAILIAQHAYQVLLMTSAIAPSLSFREFLETDPDDGKRYELVNGARVERMATRAHDDVADFIYDAFRD